jgi:precorrin-8X/cobalt-precorrin-8 methylmutase
LAEVLVDKINHLKRKRFIEWPDKHCDVLLIGHGSSDRNAREAFIYTAEAIKPHYRNVHSCFLELDQPNIEQGIDQAVGGNPKVLLIVPYFLHEGTHIKKDVILDVDGALKRHNFKNAFLGRHLGVDEKLVRIIVERAREVEKRAAV